jgi:hypothetical protein
VTTLYNHLETLEAIKNLFSQQRRAFADEMDLQAEVEDVLQRLSLPYVREANLSARDRPDFLVCGAIAIECKTKGGITPLIRQISRYAQNTAVEIIAVVSSRLQHGDLPEEVYGKPVWFLYCNGAF